MSPLTPREHRDHQQDEPDPRHEPDDDAVLEGLLHHDVEIPEAVPEDGHEVGGGHAETSVNAVSAKNSSKIGASASRKNISAASPMTHWRTKNVPGDRRDEGEPAHLLPFLAGRRA